MLGALGTLLKWIILLPVLAAVLLLAIANDQSVTVHLNPFDVGDSVLKVDLALYQVGFIVFVLGALVGALIAWSGGYKHRMRSRHRRETAFAVEAERQRTPPARPPTNSAAAFLPRPERG